MFRRLSIICASAALLAGMINAPAVADPDSAGSERPTVATEARSRALGESVAASANPQAAYDGLSARDRALLNAGGRTTRVREEVTSVSPAAGGDGDFSIMTTGCWNVSSTRVGENQFGSDLWKMYLQTNFCFYSSGAIIPNGGTIRTASGSTHWPGWSWESSFFQSGARYGSITGKIYWQTHFKYGFAFTLENVYPCLQHIIIGQGGSTNSQPSVSSKYSCVF